MAVLIGMSLIMVGGVMQTKESSGKSKVEWAFGGFIGPIPFGFASREDLLKAVVALSIIFLFVFILLNRKLIGV